MRFKLPLSLDANKKLNRHFEGINARFEHRAQETGIYIFKHSPSMSVNIAGNAYFFGLWISEEIVQSMELKSPLSLKSSLPRETQSTVEPYDGGQAGGYERSVGDLSR
jgi:hypothetical protein